MADGGGTATYLQATLQVAPIAVHVTEEDFRAMVLVYVDDVVAIADSTNVSFWMSSIDDPAVAPVVERVDPPPVIPDVGDLAVCSTYKHWCDEEDPLLPGSPAQVFEATIFDASDSLAVKLGSLLAGSSGV